MNQTTKVDLSKEFVGTWEEIKDAHSDKLAGRRVRVIILPDSQQSSSTAATLLKNAEIAGTWEGDDFEECLRLVYDTRVDTPRSSYTGILKSSSPLKQSPLQSLVQRWFSH